MKVGIIENSKKYTGLIWCAYKIAADWAYILFINIFSYYEYISIDYNWVKYVVSWIIFILCLIIGNHISNRVFHFAYYYMLAFNITGTLAVWWTENKDNIYIIVIFTFWVIWIFCSVFGGRYLNQLKSKAKDSKELNARNMKYAQLGMIFIIAIVFYYHHTYAGSRFFLALSDSAVYRTPGTATNSISGIEAYVFEWLGYTLLPLFNAYFLLYRKYWINIIIIGCSFLCYVIWGNKTILFLAFLPFLIFMVKKLFDEINMHYIIFGTTILVFFSDIIYKIYGIIAGISYFSRFAFTAEMHFLYIDFFQDNPLIFLRNTFPLRLIADSPYDKAVSIIIGSLHAGPGGYNNMSNGLISDAYANFGIAGMIIWPILYISIIALYDHFTRNINEVIRYTMLFIILQQMISTGPFQVFLSGGVVVLLIIFGMFSKRSRRG